MSPSSSALQCFLAGMEYPATDDDLVREALRDGLDVADVDVLRALPHGSYAACRHVLMSLASIEQRELVAA